MKLFSLLSLSVVLAVACSKKPDGGGGPVTPPTAVVSAYYVSPSGNDANAGTAEKPFATIGKAVGTPLSAFDIKDVTRPVDGDGNGTAVGDLGAHEYK